MTQAESFCRSFLSCTTTTLKIFIDQQFNKLINQSPSARSGWVGGGWRRGWGDEWEGTNTGSKVKQGSSLQRKSRRETTFRSEETSFNRNPVSREFSWMESIRCQHSGLRKKVLKVQVWTSVWDVTRSHFYHKLLLYLTTRLLTLMARKLSPLSLARALAIMVLEQPGGP